MRKILVLFVAFLAVGTLASCKSSSGGSSQAFCDQVDEAEASLESPDAGPDEFLAVLDELIADAPSDIKADLETLRDAYAEFLEVDESDPAAVAAASEAAQSPEVIEASENIEAYGVEECDIEPTPPASEQFSEVGSVIETDP